MGETTVILGNYNAQFVVLDMSDTDKLDVTMSELEIVDPVVVIEGPDAEIVDLRVIVYRGSSITVLRGVEGKVTLEGFKEKLSNGTRFLVMAVGPAGSKESYSMKVEIMPYPTLDELVGIYEDGEMTTTNIIIDPAYKAYAQAASEAAAAVEHDFISLEGCDMSTILTSLEESVGNTNPIPFEIEKTGEKTGIFILGTRAVLEEAEPDDPMLFMYTLNFTYENGMLRAENTVSEGGATMTFTLLLSATYGQDKKTVELKGSYNGNSTANMPEYSGEVMTMAARLEGTKPLPPKP